MTSLARVPLSSPQDLELYNTLTPHVSLPLELHHMAIIITKVVKASPHLDKSYSDYIDAFNLIIANPVLQAKIRRAWTRKNFDRLRTSKLLRPPRTGTRQKGAILMVRSTSQEAALHAAWRMTFEGNAAILLTQAIDELFDTSIPDRYTRILPVVQSSGTGKSRTIDEVAKTRITFPLCLREETTSTAYPNPDRQVRDHLGFIAKNVSGENPMANSKDQSILERSTVLGLEDANMLKESYAVDLEDDSMEVESTTTDSEDQSVSEESTTSDTEDQNVSKRDAIVDPGTQGEVRRKLAVFLDALLDEGCALVKTLCIGEGRISYAELAMRFYDYFDFEDQRGAFYARVVKKALAQHKALSNVEFDNTFRAFLDACRAHSTPLDDFPSEFPVVLYIDEMHTLFGKTTEERTVYDELCSVLSDFKHSELAVVCLSTTSKFSSIAPAPSASNSHRARGAPISSTPSPFTLLEFDTFAPKVVENTLGLRSVMEFEFLAGFGRPLWFTYLSSLKDQPLTPLNIAESVLDLAKTKLTLQQNRPLKRLSFEAAIAVLSIRMLLDIEPDRTESRNLTETLVASHMRIAFTVPEHREYMRTGTPSEPLLVEAASIIMNPSASSGTGKTPQAHKDDFDQYMSALLTFFGNGFAPKGERGEFMGRLMDILAIDAAIKDMRHTLAPLRQANLHVWCTPVPVLKYLEHLLGKNNLEQIKTLLPLNPKEIDPKFSTLTLEKAFSDAYVHFTHYQRAEDSTVLETKYLWAYWARGIALQLKPGQILSDRVLPIYWKTFDGTRITAPEGPSAVGDDGYLTLGRHTCSAILHQDKNSSISYTSIKPQKPSKLGMFEGVDPKPVLAINHIYGHKGEPAIKSKPQSDRGTRGRMEPPYEAPIFEVSILGLHSNNYGPIAIRSGQEKFKGLLADHGVYDDQKRQDAGSLNGLRRLLPAHGEDTMHWATLVDE